MSRVATATTWSSYTFQNTYKISAKNKSMVLTDVLWLYLQYLFRFLLKDITKKTQTAWLFDYPYLFVGVGIKQPI